MEQMQCFMLVLAPDIRVIEYVLYVYKNQTYCTVYRGIHSNRNRFRISAEFQIIFEQFSTVQYL